MANVSISDFRANLLNYLQRAHDGEELTVSSHGVVLAAISPPVNKQAEAKKTLNRLAKTALIGDIVSPTAGEWKALK